MEMKISFTSRHYVTLEVQRIRRVAEWHPQTSGYVNEEKEFLSQSGIFSFFDAFWRSRNCKYFK